MNQDISFFLPVRKGSQRVKNKNTRPFAGVEGGLLEIKLEQLAKCEFCKEIILSTNDEKAIKISKKIDSDKIRLDERPEYLCSSDTLVKDLIEYVPKIVNASHIFWVHTTAPFVTEKDYMDAAEKYFDSLDHGYDSLMSVTKHQFFIWDSANNKILNTDPQVNPWPNTQDLDPIYEINHAFYISSSENYSNQKNRIGRNPKLYELEKIKTIDIDWEDDFYMAEALYKLSF